MMLGEVAPGGVGAGLYGILIMAVIAVFIAGLLGAVAYFQRLGVFSWPRQIDV